MFRDIKYDVLMMFKLESFDYARRLYHSLCNSSWQKVDVIYKASWRYNAERIVELKGEGDYMDLYNSGLENSVDREVEEDLKRLGWTCIASDATFI